MAQEKVYAKGIMGFEKKQSQPDFVIGSMVVTLNDFFQFCKDNAQLQTEYQGKKQLRLQILKGKEGKLNIMVDTYVKPEGQITPQAEAIRPPAQQYATPPPNYQPPTNQSWDDTVF